VYNSEKKDAAARPNDFPRTPNHHISGTDHKLQLSPRQMPISQSGARTSSYQQAFYINQRDTRASTRDVERNRWSKDNL